MPRSKSDRNKLTLRYARFAAEYVIDENASRAAIAVGYSGKWNGQAGSELLKKPQVKAILARLQAERLSKLSIKAETVLEELRRLAFWNIDDYIRKNADGTADIDLSKATRDQLAAVTEITVDTTGGTGDGERRQVLRTKIKMADKARSLEMLARHLSLFNDKVQVSGLLGLADKLAEIRRGAN